MKRLLITLAVLYSTCLFAQHQPLEIIYGRKDGMALTMQILRPTHRNGKGIISVVSGGWRSSYENVAPYVKEAKPLVDRGYTVFLVLHSSVPRYTVDEAAQDIQRAVRFIRLQARAYQIDPDAIGIMGASAGGHLALLAATTSSLIDTTQQDPTNHVSARVQAVACLYPPTDFLDFGKTDYSPFTNKAFLKKYNRVAAFDFKEWDERQKKYTSVKNSGQKTALLKKLSPVYQVSSDDPPVLLIHGDADPLIPLQQSELLISKLKQVNVPCELRIKKGGGHGWDNETEEMNAFADWFDKYLK